MQEAKYEIPKGWVLKQEFPNENKVTIKEEWTTLSLIGALALLLLFPIGGVVYILFKLLRYKTINY